MLLQLDRINYTPPNFTHPLLTDITFNLAAGEAITLTGATGAGKSTLFRLLNRLSEPTSGQILLGGVNYQTLPSIDLRRRIMLVSQEPKFLGMKVTDALAYPLKLQALSEDEIKQRLVTITEQFEIPTEWFERTELQLSAGQKQIVSIARGVITQPQILLLDEPIAHLDFTTAERILTTLKGIATTQQIGMITINHQLELATKFSDRLLYLQDRKIVLDRITTSLDWQNIQAQIRESEQTSIAEWE